VVFMGIDPQLRPLRGVPRFEGLIALVGAARPLDSFRGR
jgi:hypothetical protein